MKTRVQIIANSGFHKIPTVIISIYKTQYIFNIIPTLIRHRKDHKINLYKSAHIFFTKNSIQATGGLPNYLLFRHGFEHATQEVSNRLYLYVDNQLYNYFQKLRFKLGYKILRTAYTTWDGMRNRLGVNCAVLQEFRARLDLPNIYIKIDNLIRESYEKDRDYYTATDFLSTNPTPYINIPCMYYHHEFMDIYPIRENKMDNGSTTSYICIPALRKGGVDVDIEKFKFESKINKQKLVQDLIVNGFVKNEQGKIFKKRDYYFQNDHKPQNIIIFHYSTKQSAVKLSTNPIFINYQKNKNPTCLVVHILQNLQLLNEPQFHLLFQSFSSKTKHYWYHKDLHIDDGDNMVFLSQLKIYHHFFPYLFKPTIFKSYNQLSQSFIEMVSNILPSSHSFFYKKLFHFIVNDFLSDRYQKRFEVVKPAQSKADIILRLIQSNIQLKKKLNNLSKKQKTEFKPQVIFLGTSSSMPLYNRNTLGILVSLSQKFKILMDCGQGTLQQLQLGTNLQATEDQLLKIRIIFITHIHSDHNLGILNIISERNRQMKARNNQQKVFLIIPFNVYNWFVEYCNKVEDLSEGCQVIFTQILNGEEITRSRTQEEINLTKDKACKPRGAPFFKKKKGQKTETKEQQITHKDLQGSSHIKLLINNKLLAQKQILQIFNKELARNNITTFRPIKVIHCPQSYGIIIANQKYKMCYSGDTRPSKDFEEASSCCNLMIHESTYNDHEKQKAISHLHSTVTDALTVAKNAKAAKLILTHFNEDFESPSIANLSPSLKKYYLNDTIISFDLLNVPFDDMKELPWMSQQLFKIQKQADKIYQAMKDKLRHQE